MNTKSFVAFAIAAVSVASTDAAADPSATVVGGVETPRAPRVFHVPTGWLQPSGAAYASSGLTHRGSGFFSLAAGLGDIAELDVKVTDRATRCSPCDGDDRSVKPAPIATALFKVGIPDNRWFSGQPALSIGFRKSFFVHTPDDDAVGDTETAELYLAASVAAGPVSLHGGAQLFDAQRGDSPRLLQIEDPASQIRPFAGIEWRPEQYPRTTVLADFSWSPELQTAVAPDDSRTGTTALSWLAGWGVRYQALSWGSIELAVRHRQGGNLDDSTVFIRVNGIASLSGLGAPKKTRGRAK